MFDRLTVIQHTWRTPQYVAFLVGAALVISAIITVRNITALTGFFNATDSLWATVQFFVVLHAGLFTLFSVLGTVAIVALAILLSMNVILIVQFVRRQQKLTTNRISKRATAHHLGSITAVILGIGCASCGYAVLLSVLSVFGATGLIALLPLHGEELSLIGIAGLLYSNWYLLGKLHQPGVCGV